MRVEQDLVLPLKPPPHIQDGQVLGGQPLEKEIPAADGRGHAHGIDLDQPGQEILELRPAGDLVEDVVGVGILGLDPGPGVRTLLVFEPAVVVGDGHPVKIVGHGDHVCFGRGRDLDGIGAAGDKQERQPNGQTHAEQDEPKGG